MKIASIKYTAFYAQRLYNDRPLSQVPTDPEGRVRVDDYEMREDVQSEVGKLWEMVANENLYQIRDVKGYNSDFLKLFGFGLKGVDYNADVPTDIPIAGLS